MHIEDRHVPSFGKVGPIRHHVPGEHLVLLGVVLGGVERVAEDVEDLVGVHHAGPLGPRVHARPLLEVILVHEVLAHGVTVERRKTLLVVSNTTLCDLIDSYRWVCFG